MSRHKLIKNLDLDEELDDYDGGEEYEDGEEEISEEDKESLRVGTIQVRGQLPSEGAHITDKQIQDSLWHTYYDVEKTVGYLIANFVVKPREDARQALEKKKMNKNTDFAPARTCSNQFSVAAFFKDMPWLNVPSENRTTFIAPLYPSGLLGGSSNGAPKMSKLQALAAARKKKAQEQKPDASSGVEKPMAALSLGKSNEGQSSDVEPGTISGSRQAARSFPNRKRKDSNPHEKSSSKASSTSRIIMEPAFDAPVEDQTIDLGHPSAFASTMFGASNRPPPAANLFSLPYVAAAPASIADPFAGPSPDDVVIAAQSKAGGKGGKGPPKTSGEKKADQISNGVEALKLDGTPRATSKNLDVLKEYETMEKKNEASFVVIGHVDAGKSTLMGRLLFDLNVVDQRTIDKYRKEAEKMGKSSFALAWVLDQGTEERSRGVTIDIAMNKFSTSKTNFTILDAPGHRDFIPNMIAGASQADFAVLVIDASTGSFESGLRGQTKEHALLVRSMGIQRIIIAVNKLDAVSWSHDRFEEISQQISAFLTSAGFLPKNISFVPCSGLHGDNIARHSTEAAFTSWYSGPTLVDELEKSEPTTRALTKPLRLTIADIFRGGVQNPLSVSGRIEAGSLQTGDALLAQPAGEKCFIKGLEVDSEPRDWAVAGQNLTVHLSDIDAAHLKVGDVLCSPAHVIPNVKQFTAKVLAFEFLTPMQVDVHRGRLHAAGRITQIVALLDKATGGVLGGEAGKKNKRPRIVKPAQLARVLVELETAVPLEAPARVVLRCNGETVAAGLLE